jgi:hypothetical protein
MMTPPFACGPLPEPVTILCVAIATEDGCFLSGLRHRFEFGHLYPSNEATEDMSAICIAVEPWSLKAGNDQQQSTSPSVEINTSRISDAARSLTASAVFDDNNSKDCSCGEASSSTNVCDCIFQGVTEKQAGYMDGDEEINIFRGRLGPGLWHCYSVVVDGENSAIRIDGIAEPVQSEVSSSADDKIPASFRTITAMLDGLTIGSDHCFGISLCCGNGSGGEGEGAIAELAIFQGRLDLTDLQELEVQIMRKHGIQRPSAAMAPQLPTFTEKANGSCDGDDSRWEENEFKRQAHAMFSLQHDEERTSSIPLRFLSQHRSVAWRQTNPVTGEPIHTSKIGAKRQPAGDSSSDL